MDNSDLARRYSQLYLEVILRYKEYIESKEDLSVAELPSLVTPQDESVVALASKIKAGFPDYSYERDFYSAAKAAFDYVHDEIALAPLPIQFWLRPKDTLKCAAGDAIDKAALLCSLLIALGAPSTKVVISASDDARKVIVYSEYKGILMIDTDNGIKLVKDRDEFVKELGISDSSTAYEFNDKMYNDLA